MELHEAQTKIASDLHRFRVLVCGRKFGKTTLATQEIMGAAIYKDAARVLYMAPTLEDARGLMWEPLKKAFKKSIIKENDTRLELTVPNVHKGKSYIFLGSWEKRENYRGYEYDLIIFDETQEYKEFWDGWENALRPTLTPRKGSAMFMGTPKGFNHLYDLYNLEYKPEYKADWKAFRFTTYDNPHIDRDEINDAKRMLTDDRFSQEYLAEFKKAEGLVFPEFSRETHLYDYDLYDYTEHVAGVDWGYHVAAVPDIKIKGGVFYVDNELYRSKMTDEEVCDYVASRRFHKVYPDPESAAGIAILKKKAVNVRDVKKGKGSIEHGIQTMRELFKQNRLRIHKRCINLITELEMYSYPEKRPGHNENENPQDEYNHAIDAVRYIVDNHTIAKPYIPRPFYDRTKEIWNGR